MWPISVVSNVGVRIRCCHCGFPHLCASTVLEKDLFSLPFCRPLSHLTHSLSLSLAGARRRRGPIGEHEPALGVPRIREPNHWFQVKISCYLLLTYDHYHFCYLRVSWRANVPSFTVSPHESFRKTKRQLWYSPWCRGWDS